MRIEVEPALCIAGTQIRAVVAVDCGAVRLPRGGVAGRGGKWPVGIVVGSGVSARLVALDGSPRDPENFGLARRDIE